MYLLTCLDSVKSRCLQQMIMLKYKGNNFMENETIEIDDADFMIDREGNQIDIVMEPEEE